MTLFEIDADIRAFLDGLYEQGDEDGVVSDADVSKLNALQQERKKKLENVALYYKELKAEAEALDAESKKLAARSKSVANRAEWFKKYISDSMISNGDKELKTSRCALTFKSSKRVVVDEDRLPKKYFIKKVEFSPDKKSLLELLKGGSKIKGAQLEIRQNIQIN